MKHKEKAYRAKMVAIAKERKTAQHSMKMVSSSGLPEGEAPPPCLMVLQQLPLLLKLRIRQWRKPPLLVLSITLAKMIMMYDWMVKRRPQTTCRDGHFPELCWR